MPSTEVLFLICKCHIEEPLSAVERSDLSHFIGGQFKVEDVKIVFHVVGIRGFREHDIACLNVPAQDYLHIALAVLFSKFREHCFTNQPLVTVPC